MAWRAGAGVAEGVESLEQFETMDMMNWPLGEGDLPVSWIVISVAMLLLLGLD